MTSHTRFAAVVLLAAACEVPVRAADGDALPDGAVARLGVARPRWNAQVVAAFPDGQTVIIGGLMQDSKAEAENKIPILGDLPLLGNLFKRKSKNDSKTELLIFLTPHIIYAPTEMASVSAREEAKSSVKKTFTEDELNKFIERLPSDEPPVAPSSKKRSRK